MAKHPYIGAGSGFKIQQTFLPVGLIAFAAAGEADPRSPQYPEDPPVPIPRNCTGIEAPRLTGHVLSRQLPSLPPPPTEPLSPRTDAAGGGLPVALCRFQGPHAFSPGCALCWCFRLSGAACRGGRLLMENRHESPGPCLCCRLTGLLFFMCSDSR